MSCAINGKRKDCKCFLLSQASAVDSQSDEELPGTFAATGLTGEFAYLQRKLSNGMDASAKRTIFSVLDSTGAEWNHFKTEHPDLDTDLQNHRRRKGFFTEQGNIRKFRSDATV